MGRPSRMMQSLLAVIEERFPPESELDDFPRETHVTPEEQLEKRRSELKNGLTDLQRLFLFGKLGGLNDKDAAIAAGYSLSVAENTKQRIWKPQVLAEYERVREGLSANTKSRKPDIR
jgi:hypothetical protein